MTASDKKSMEEETVRDCAKGGCHMKEDEDGDESRIIHGTLVIFKRAVLVLYVC